MDNIPPEILALLDEMTAGGEASLSQEILAEKLRAARKMQETEMPDRIHRLGQDKFSTIMAPSHPLEYVNAALRQGLGGAQARDISGQMQAGVGKEAKAYRALMMAQMLRDQPQALQPSNGAMMTPDPSTMTDNTPAWWTDPWAMPATAPVVRRKPKPSPGAPPAATTPASRGVTGEW